MMHKRLRRKIKIERIRPPLKIWGDLGRSGRNSAPPVAAVVLLVLRSQRWVTNDNTNSDLAQTVQKNIINLQILQKYNWINHSRDE